MTGSDLPRNQPLLHVVAGRPTDSDMAALVVVLAARSAAAPARSPRAGWTDPAARLRRPLRPGAAGWRRSGRPG